jgi:hypothetical protein
MSVLDEAERAIQLAIKPAGNRADEALHDFVRNIFSVYQEAAVDPRNPYYDGELGEEQGEFLDFLNTCLLPLEVNMTFSALLGLYRRAIDETKPQRT